MKPKHLSCIGVCCFQLAARVVEEECNIPSAHEIIRISQCKCTVSDLKRMEKIISEKLHFEFKATTALTFLHLYHTIVLCHTSERWVEFRVGGGLYVCEALSLFCCLLNDYGIGCGGGSSLVFTSWQANTFWYKCCFSWVSYRKEVLNLDKLEAQLKACNCRLVFSKAKVSRSSFLWLLSRFWFMSCWVVFFCPSSHLSWPCAFSLSKFRLWNLLSCLRSFCVFKSILR